MQFHMGMEMGLAGLKSGFSFISGLQEARSARKWQAYNNAMTRIADGQNQNAITTNTNLAIERSTVQGFEIERSVYQTTAAAEAAAAGALTAGRSVNQTIYQLERNGIVAQANRKADLQAQMLGFDNQRRTSSFQAAQQIDYTHIPNPSPIAAMLGFAGDAQTIYRKYNT